MKPDRRMLVVLAHPDDESFPIGGSPARYAAQGVHITLACATKGEAGIAGLTAAEAARIRELELNAAAHVLGLAEVQFLGWEDGRVEQRDRPSAVAQIVQLLHAVRPQVIVTFGADGISGHPDHVALHDLVTAAAQEAAMVEKLFYILPSEATFQGCGVPPAVPEKTGTVVSIDVSNHRVTKVNAMQCHRSQNPPFADHPEIEANRLACHEYFVTARPLPAFGSTEDLFVGTTCQEISDERIH